MRATAEILKLAGAINGDLLIGRGELLNEMTLHEVAFGLEALQAFAARQKFAGIGQIALYQFLHLLLDLFQIFGIERSGPIEVIEKSAIGGRAVAELGFGKQLQHRRSHL